MKRFSQETMEVLEKNQTSLFVYNELPLIEDASLSPVARKMLSLPHKRK